jgi:hypothetical protein
VGSSDEGRVRARGVRPGRRVVVAPHRGAAGRAGRRQHRASAAQLRRDRPGRRHRGTRAGRGRRRRPCRADQQRRADRRGGAQLRRHRHRRGRRRRGRRAAPAAGLQLPAGGRAVPGRLRRGRRPGPLPRRRPGRRHLRRPARAAGGHVPAGLRQRRAAAGRRAPGPAGRAGPRPDRRGGLVARRALDLPGLRAGPADRQREFAQRAGRVMEIDAGHHPFLSRPAEVRDLVLGLSG